MSSTPQELEGMKAVIAGKIKELPPDDATAKALREIEELLQHVNAGGRMGMIYDQLEQIRDPAVLAAQKLLARYILSMDVSVQARQDFFKLWKADKIVQVSKILSKEKVSFEEVFTNYGKNEAITEFVNDVMEISELGMGRGEFGLNVLSKSVWAPEDGKGDLKMKLGSSVLQIECKTSMGGAARFSDQEVRPAEGYEQSAIDLNNAVKKSKTFPLSMSHPKGFPGYGLNLTKAVEFYQNAKGAEKENFINLVKRTVTLIFGGKGIDADDKKRLAGSVNGIVSAIKAGDTGAAMQSWAQASFNYYMSKKDDDGVLFIDLVNKEFVFYAEASDLTSQGLRLDAKTIYLSTVKDPGRGVYPQIEVVPTTFGGAAAQKTFPKAGKKVSDVEFNDNLFKWAKKFANRRAVGDARVIRGMMTSTQKMLANNLTPAQIIASLEQQYPALQPKVKVKPKAPAPVAPKPAAPPAAPATV